MNIKLPLLATSLKNRVDISWANVQRRHILGKCAIPLWISGLNVRYIDGILGKYGISWVDGECVRSSWIFGLNVQDHNGYLE